MSDKIIFLRLCLVVFLINDVKKTFFFIYIFVYQFSPCFFPWNVQHVFLWSLVLLLRSYNATYFHVFHAGKSRKILENILENTGMSCSNLDAHPGVQCRLTVNEFHQNYPLIGCSQVNHTLRFIVFSLFFTSCKCHCTFRIAYQTF